MNATAGDLEHYLVTRLATDDQDSTDEDKKIRKLDISRSFAAFRKRQAGDEAWIASRTEAATRFFGDQTDLSEQDLHLRELASTLGYPEDIIEQLRCGYQDDLIGAEPTVLGYCRWVFDWLAAHPNIFLRIISQEDLEYLFGKPLKDCQTDKARAELALPQFRKLLTGWLKGKTYEEMQATLQTTARDKAKCTGARKFVLRIIPNLAHFMSALALIEKPSAGDEHALPPALEKLNYCVRRGYQSIEMAALRSTLDENRINRREIHRLFAKLKPHLGHAPDEETWDALRDRVDEALSVELLSRDIPENE